MRYFYLLLFIFPISIFSQTPGLLQFGIKDGLPSNHVYFTTRDASGFLWVCTDEGIARFDGFESKVFNTNGNLPAQDIWGAYLDEENRIWLTTFNEVIYYQNGRFQTLKGSVKSDFAIIKYFEKPGPGIYFRTKEERGNLYYANENEYHKVKRFQEFHILELKEFRENAGLVLVKKEDYHFFRYGPEEQEELIRFPGHANIKQAFIHSAFRSFFFTEKKVYSYHDNQIDSLELSGIIGEEDRFERAFMLPNERMAIYTDRGVYMVDFDFKIEENYSFLNDYDINYISEDRYGNLWIATSDKLLLLTPKARNTLRMDLSSKPKENRATCLEFAPDGSLWIGTRTGQLFQLDHQKRILECFDFKKQYGSKHIRAIHLLSEDTLLVGGDFGLALLSKSGPSWCDWQPVKHFTGNIKSISPFYQTAIICSAEGVFTFSKRDLRLDTINNQRTYASVFDKDQQYLYFGRKSGLYVSEYKEASFTPVRKISDTSVSGLALDKKKRLYIASDNDGLLVLNGSNIEKPDIFSGKPIKEVTLQNPDVIWLLQQSQITRINIDSSRFQMIKNHPISFGSGIGKNKINDFQLKEDTVFLGTDNGLLILTPFKEYNYPTEPLNLNLKNIYINKEQQPIQLHYDLPYFNNRIKIDFICPDFQDLNEVQYEVQFGLIGKDLLWEFTKIPSKEYIGLAPGKYAFKVKASSSSNKNSQIIATTFHIQKPFWKRSWFIGLLILTILGMLTSIYRYQLGQILKIHRIRNQISDDLHDEIGSTLGYLNILVALLKKKKIKDRSSMDILDQIEDEIQSSSTSLDDIIWSINPKNDSISIILARMRRYLTESFEANGINYEIDFPVSKLAFHISMDRRRNFYLCFKEAVHNILKHSQCDTVKINLKIQDGDLVLSILDNGVGFNITSASDAGNGLWSMQKRAKELNGSLEISSAPGKGTHLFLHFPIT